MHNFLFVITSILILFEIFSLTLFILYLLSKIKSLKVILLLKDRQIQCLEQIIDQEREEYKKFLEEGEENE